jgi:hypothetical protein
MNFRESAEAARAKERGGEGSGFLFCCRFCKSFNMERFECLSGDLRSGAGEALYAWASEAFERVARGTLSLAADEGVFKTLGGDMAGDIAAAVVRLAIRVMTEDWMDNFDWLENVADELPVKISDPSRFCCSSWR